MAKKKTKKRKPGYFAIIGNRLKEASQRAKRAKVEAFTFGPIELSDKSVDGEIRFIRPHGEETRSFILDVEQWVIIPRGAWVSVGGRFEATTSVMDHVANPSTSRYEKEQGLINIGAFFQRGRSKAAVFLAARKYVTGMEQTVKRRALEIYVRLHWSPDDTQPARLGKAVNKRRKVKKNVKKTRRSGRATKANARRGNAKTRGTKVSRVQSRKISTRKLATKSKRGKRRGKTRR